MWGNPGGHPGGPHGHHGHPGGMHENAGLGGLIQGLDVFQGDPGNQQGPPPDFQGGQPPGFGGGPGQGWHGHGGGRGCHGGLRRNPSMGFDILNAIRSKMTYGQPLQQCISQLLNAGSSGLRSPVSVGIPPDVDTTNIRNYAYEESMGRYGFYFPGLINNMVSRTCEWTPTDLEDGSQGFMTAPIKLSNVADINSRNKERDPDNNRFGSPSEIRTQVGDSPQMDAEQLHQWLNWVVPTFTPRKPIPLHPKLTGENPVYDGISLDVSTFQGSSTKFNNLLSDLNSRMEKFTDQEFPASRESIIGFGEDGQDLSEYTGLIWLRPDVIFKGKDYQVFSDDTNPNDIDQGGLGDCYFLSTLASLTEVSARIQRIVYSKEANKPGIYCVAFVVTGVWEEVIIDDQFVCKPGSHEPAFDKTSTNELWVMILEKAWAKVYGGFNNIVGGLIREALHDLTGAPAITFFNSEGSEDDHWNTLLDADRRGYTMCTGTDEVTTDPKNTILVNGHAYSLISVFEIVNDGHQKRLLGPQEKSNPNNARIVKLRNPWGEGVWKGAWRYDDPNWTDSLRQQCGCTNEENGIFFMSLKDYLRQFYDYQICYFHDDYIYSGQKFTSSPTKPALIGFQIDKDGEYFFQINQVSARTFRKSSKYAYSSITLIIAQVDQPNPQAKVKFIGSICKADKDMWFKAQCSPGFYVAYVVTKWKKNVNEFGFAVYGPGRAMIQSITESQIPPTFIEKVMMEKAKKDKTKDSGMRDFAAQGYSSISYKFGSSADAMGYFYFTNNSQDTQLTATVRFLYSSGIEILPPYDGSDRPKIVVGPGEEKILLYRMSSDKSQVEFQIAASFAKGVAQVKNDIPSNSQRIPIFDASGQDVGIGYYFSQGPQGITAVYENKSQNLTLFQKLEFNLSGCIIQGVNGNIVDFRVAPGQTYAVKIVSTSGSSYQASPANQRCEIRHAY